MWIFLSDSFLSIVQHSTKEDVLVVRARRKGDIESVFPEAKVVTIPNRDYQFRAELDRVLVAEAIYRKTINLTHTNFKNSVHDDDYHHACSQVWGVMARLQDEPPYSAYGTPRMNRARASQKGIF